MIELYKPDMYKKSIYDIDYKKLKNYGIKCILFDLDNTLVPYTKNKPSRKLKDFIERIKDEGFKVIIFSNSNKKRLTASCRKPSKFKFKKVLDEYKFLQSEVAIIGDQITTDIFGGNRMGIFTILIKPISNEEFFYTKISRLIEKKIIKKLEKKNLFKRGNYYD